jgi:hypothetical protein
LGRNQTFSAPDNKLTTGQPTASLNQTQTVRTNNRGGLEEERNLVHPSKGHRAVLDGRLNVFSAVAHNPNSVRAGQAIHHQSPGHTTTPCIEELIGEHMVMQTEQ